MEVRNFRCDVCGVEATPDPSNLPPPDFFNVCVWGPVKLPTEKTQHACSSACGAKLLEGVIEIMRKSDQSRHVLNIGEGTAKSE